MEKLHLKNGKFGFPNNIFDGGFSDGPGSLKNLFFLKVQF